MEVKGSIMLVREIQSKISQTFMIIRITYTKLLNGSDFFHFSPHELLMRNYLLITIALSTGVQPVYNTSYVK